MSATAKSLTVLIADDSPVIRKIMRTHLEEHSCKIVECTDGLRAIDMSIAMKPRVIILDINMPNMNGIECLKVLKSKATTRLIPVIMCTSTSNRETVLECARAGACDFIVKPVNHKVLYEKILRIAGNQQEDKH